MNQKPNHHTYRPITPLMALALCLTMCLPTAMVASAHGNTDSQTPTALTYQFLFKEPTLSATRLDSRTFTQLHLTGAMNLGKDVGGPSIPVSFVKLALPPMTTVDTLTVSGPAAPVDTGTTLLDHPVTPFQKELPAGSDAPTTIAFNPSIYSLQTPYPQSPYDGSYDIGYCRGYAILSLPLMPVQYIPAQGTLLYHPQLTITITLKSAPMNQFYRNSADDAAWVQSLVCNPDVVASYSTQGRATTEYPGGLCDPSQHFDYVIVTTTHNSLDHWDTSDQTPYNWDSLITEHSQDGLQSTVVTVQDINACTDYFNTTPMFNDLQAHIREFCKDAYQDWGTQYVLIAGDSDQLPSRLMDSNAESGVDADIYFSNLDKNFNADQDSHWGEEGDIGFDLYSELYVGRITCDQPQDVSNWLTKSFNYANQGDPNILDNAAFYSGEMGWPVGGDEFEDYCAIKGTHNWLGPQPGAHGPYPTWLGFQFGFETWNATYSGIPYNLSIRWTAESSPHPGWQGGNQDAAIMGLRDAINNDLVSLISGVAHADPTCSLDVYDTDWESQYHNTHPFFITDWGCHCGDFDDGDGVLETMLFYSNTSLAFGCVYNTGYGWGCFMDTNSSSALQQKCFWDYLFDVENNSGNIANWQLGKAHMFSKDEMAPTLNWTYSDAPGSWRETIQCMTLFADPAQKLKPVRENHAPATPTAPIGPVSGTVAVNYTFTTSTTDPDNDGLLYLFDWGDGTNSGWVGPFASGAPGNATHFWTYGGNFTVKVMAKDTIGLPTGWSDPVTILIGAPILQVQEVTGGIGVKVTLINVGDGNAKTSWRVTVTGGLRGLITLQNSGNIDSLPVNEPQTIHPFNIFVGFGRITIIVEASAVYGNSIKTDATAFLFGPFVLNVKLK